MSLLRNIRARLFGPRCEHQWENTGEFYTDSQHGFTIVTTECTKCHTTLIVEV